MLQQSWNRFFRLAGSLILFGALLVPRMSLADNQAVYETVKLRRGLVVELGSGDGQLAAALGKAEPACLIHALAHNDNDLQASRRTVDAAGLYGQVTVGRLDGARLPYADNLVNILIVSNPGGVPQQELMRVLSPLGFLLVREGDGWKKTQKPWTKGMADWTHYNYNASNTGTSEDEFIGPPDSIQWKAGPKYSRSHETDPSTSALVSSQGRIFYIEDEGPIGITDQRIPSKWSLVARDGFSGIELWRIPMTKWGWQAWKPDSIYGNDWRLFIGDRILNPSGLMRRLVAHEDRLYLTLGYDSAVSEVDATSGAILRTFKGTEGASELIQKDDLLFMVIGFNTTGVLGKQDTKTFTSAELACVDLQSGKMLWRKPIDAITVWSLCADQGKIYYCDGEAIIALHGKTGEVMWKNSSAFSQGNLDLIRSGFSLASYKGVLLTRNRNGMSAFSMESGRNLWDIDQKTHWGSVSTPVMLLSAGLVWNFESTEGYDPKTGKLVRKLEKPEWLISEGHHPRCYQGRNTEKFLMTNKRGIEFWDTVNDTNYMKYDWARSNCRVGYAPANGMLYLTPHPCRCYMGNRLVGFNALLSRNHSLTGLTRSPGKLVKGTPVSLEGSEAEEGDWPAFRRDALRSGSVKTKLATAVKPGWKAELGGQLTQPVIAGGKVFVATKDTDSVYALDEKTGKQLWRFIAGGGIDSSPTYYKGLLLFGSFDGWVYCLSADTGKLAWKFRAAPEDRLITHYGKLASTWPVHGTVLMLDGTAYFHAGRNTHIDGGLFVYGLDPETGAVKHFKQLETTLEKLKQFEFGARDFPGTREDVMVSDGTDIYIQKLCLTKELEEKELEFINQEGGVRKWGRHLYATGSLLDESNFNRNYWMLASLWTSSNFANQAPNEGQMIVFDEAATYAVKYFHERNVYSAVFFPETKGYLLYADRPETEPGLYADKEGPKPIKWLSDAGHSRRGMIDKTYNGKGGSGPGFTRFDEPLWMDYIPIRVRGMAKTDGKLFVAGPPDIMPKEDPMIAFEGRAGAKLRCVDTKTGKTLTEQDLADPPVYDGVSAANGALYLSDLKGTVHCFK